MLAFYSLLLCNYHITGIAGVGQELQGKHEYISTRNTGHCTYIIQDSRTGFLKYDNHKSSGNISGGM